MSFAELKEQVAVLSLQKRSQLAAFLSKLNEAESQAEMNRRMKAMDAGKKVSEEELLKLHKRLRAKGR